jgi:hypothetical protein
MNSATTRAATRCPKRPTWTSTTTGSLRVSGRSSTPGRTSCAGPAPRSWNPRPTTAMARQAGPCGSTSSRLTGGRPLRTSRSRRLKGGPEHRFGAQVARAEPGDVPERLAAAHPLDRPVETWSDQDVRRVLSSPAYLEPQHARREEAQRLIRAWFERRFGTGAARVDGDGSSGSRGSRHGQLGRLLCAGACPHAPGRQGRGRCALPHQPRGLSRRHRCSPGCCNATRMVSSRLSAPPRRQARARRFADGTRPAWRSHVQLSSTMVCSALGR